MSAAFTLVDSHCHLDDEKFNEDRQQVIDRALDGGVDRMVAIGTGHGPPDLEAGLRLSRRHEQIYATVGVHPHDASKADEETFSRLRELVAEPKIVALGEIGLDYHYDFSPRETQRDVFVRQLALAREAALPIVIHTREAWDDTFRLLGEQWPADGPGGIMHCFSGGPEEAERSLEMGFYLSFAGIVTYKKAPDVREAARRAPLDRILVETDSPYLAPVPNRGKRNEPLFVVETARRLAELRGDSFEQLAAATTANWERLCLRAAGA